MAIRYWLTPKTGDGLTQATAFSAKHVVADRGWTGLDYGLDDLYLVAQDVSDDETASLAKEPEVLLFPADLSGKVAPADRDAVVSYLKAAKLPADYVTTALTYKDILSDLVRVLHFAQRYHAVVNTPIVGKTSSVEATVGTKDSALQTVAASLGLKPSAVKASDSLQTSLKAVTADLYPEGVVLAGERF